MIVKPLTEHHLKFLSLRGGFRGSFESTLVKMSNCSKSHATAHLTKQKLSHTADKRFICGTCGHSFIQSSDLKKHTLIHTGEKLYTCCICDKSFTQLSTLKKHELIHTDDKKFLCNTSVEKLLLRHQT